VKWNKASRYIQGTNLSPLAYFVQTHVFCFVFERVVFCALKSGVWSYNKLYIIVFLQNHQCGTIVESLENDIVAL
jgi:hypothetical protein